MEVKICGVTRREDLAAISGIGASYAGFILAEGSPRRISPLCAGTLLDACGPLGLRGVLVVRDLPLEELREMLLGLHPYAVQLHGAESPEYARALASAVSCRIWKAVRLDSRQALAEALEFPCHAIVADSGGGTGRPCDWTLAARLAALRRTFLAGGITPENLSEACRRVGPAGVDLSSGVESAPGIKDFNKLQRLKEALRK